MGYLSKGDRITQAEQDIIDAIGALGTSGQVLAVNGSATSVEWVSSGSGNVTKVGTPANNQIGVWTGDGTIEGDTNLTWDGTNFNIATARNFQIAGATILADAAGTTTLSNIDALDATTEATIEAAIDTLASLVSIQGRTVTLADAGANAVFGWDDVAGAYENLTAGEVRGAIGLATTDSPMFTAIELGHATDTTIARSGAGDITIEGNAVYRAGGTDVALADGGTGASLVDPNADRIMFWDDSAGAVAWLTAGAGLTITDTTITSYSNLTSFVGQTAWRIFYSNTDGDVVELALGADGTYLRGNGISAAPTWVTPAGSGDVTKVGTPVDNQVGVWTGNGTIEGDADLTFDSTTLTLAGVQAITVADTTNLVGLTITQNDSTNNPAALHILSAANGDTVTIQNTNAGTNGVMFETHANSATPALNDYTFQIDSYGEDSVSNKQFYGGFYIRIFDATSTSEDSWIEFLNIQAGTIRTMMKIGADSDGSMMSGITVGSSAAAAIVTSNGSQDLVLRTGNTDTGNITIVDGIGGDITITPNTTGTVKIDGIASPVTNDDGSLGTASLSWSDLFLASGAVVNYANGDTLITHSAGVLTISNTAVGATGPVLELYQDSASPAASDIIADISFYGEDSVGNKERYGFIQASILDTTSGSEDAELYLGTVTAGTQLTRIVIRGTEIVPSTNDAIALGSGTLMYSDLYLASGGIVSFNNGDVTITHSAGLLTISDPVSLGTSNSITAGTIELGHASDTTISRSAAGVIAVESVVIPSVSSTNTLTNKRITKRTGTTTSSATPTINTDNVDFYSLTAQAEAITSFTTNLSGTPTEAQTLWIAITGTAARAITWGASFEASTVALPTTTVTTARLDVGFIWNTVTSKWRCIASA